jgi:lipopolysaccharide transport system permease protein
MSSVTNDLRDSLQRIPFVLHMALSDTRARYKRSVLGPLWLTTGAAIGVVGLGLVWSSLLNQSRSELIPSLTIGLLLWQFISACVTESPAVFVRQAHVIRNIRLPFFIYPFQLLVRHLIGLAHNLIILIVVLLIYPPPISTVMLLSIVGLFLVVANLLWIITLLGMLGARFRDIEQIVQAFMPIVFFLTPVIYKIGHAGLNQSILWLNPFTYFMSIVRDPLFGQVPPTFVYVVVTSMVVCGWTLTIWFFNRRASRIAFWV